MSLLINMSINTLSAARLSEVSAWTLIRLRGGEPSQLNYFVNKAVVFQGLAQTSFLQLALYLRCLICFRGITEDL